MSQPTRSNGFMMWSLRFYTQFDPWEFGFVGSFDQHQLWDCYILLLAASSQVRAIAGWGLIQSPPGGLSGGHECCNRRSGLGIVSECVQQARATLARYASYNAEPRGGDIGERKLERGWDERYCKSGYRGRVAVLLGLVGLMVIFTIAGLVRHDFLYP